MGRLQSSLALGACGTAEPLKAGSISHPALEPCGQAFVESLAQQMQNKGVVAKDYF